MVRPLGAGGMGQVYEVIVAATGARVALKTLKPALAQDGTHLERFRREATLMGALEHPHLVRCYDFGIDDDGSAFLVVEHLDGITLHRLVAEQGPLAPARAARLGRQVASALAAAHQRGVIHRDVKPSNVMIVRGYDGGEVAKLFDFGIASVKESPTYERLTRTGQLVGTPSYMAPEQLSAQPIDARTDVYALGATLHGVLTGRPPYADDDLAVLLPRILRGDRTPLRVIRPEVGLLAMVVERAMSVDPAARFATAEELGAALARYEGGAALAPAAVALDPGAPPRPLAPEAATRPARRARPRPAPRRRWAWAVAIGTILAALAAAGTTRALSCAVQDEALPAAPPIVASRPMRAPDASSRAVAPVLIAVAPPPDTGVRADAGARAAPPAPGGRRSRVAEPHRAPPAAEPPSLPVEAPATSPPRVIVSARAGSTGDAAVLGALVAANRGAFERCWARHREIFPQHATIRGDLAYDVRPGVQSRSWDSNDSMRAHVRECLELVFYGPGAPNGMFRGPVTVTLHP